MESKIPILAHLEELRKRLILTFIAYFIFVCISYFFIDKVLILLQRPVGNLIYISPGELFLTRIKLTLFLAFMLVFPVLLLQIRAYILPAFNPKTKKTSILTALFSLILFYGGIFIAYKLFLPYTLNFLMKFGPKNITPQFTISKYISFLISFFLCFGLVVQVPLVILFLTRSGLITIKFLKKYRKHIYVLSFIIAAILTPPDIFSQIILALPLIFLYEISILISRVSRYNVKVKLRR